jgi:hypothetical protein
MCPFYLVQALGIDTSDKSARDLRLLIQDTTKQVVPRVAPSTIDPDVLSSHFEEGCFTDCSIRVKIRGSSLAITASASDRPSKRLKSEPTDSPDDAAAEGDDLGVRTIKAHSVILASRSEYFKRAMLGQWQESQDKSFEVTLADEEGERIRSMYAMVIIEA